MYVIGADVSTAITGVVVLRSNGQGDPHIVLLEHIDFSKCKDFWEKVDHAKAKLQEFRQSLTLDATEPVNVYVEESLQAFRPGLSSAATLVLLAKFNALISNQLRDMFNVDPKYVASTHARKLCGIAIVRDKTKPAKIQTFEWACAGPLSHVVWPVKKNGTPKDWAKDVVDAFVVSKAGLIIESNG